ncbi:putative thioredoxin [Paenochrobactrum gallinarii]|uniref:Thioredoxin n=1 Tax=Paenochrobactrum gallinarii TaxID=643673 RepID=A0A841LTI4_9HYPH|nr:thioredoxin [Paenochrobactrum gallinarii]MBB6260576.1 putative thioredoxin [Paenochrobactrum gallinarii]
MSNQDNPYAVSGNQMNASVSFGTDHAPAAGGLIKDTTTATFQADVIAESRKQPVLVDFWAPWCGPCKQLTPVIEGAVKKAAGAVKLVKMNIDDHPNIAGQLGIQSIPAVIAFVDGQPVDGFMGAQPESKIDEFIAKISGPSPQETALAEALAMAETLRGEGDFAQSAQVYSAILQQMPDNLAALAGLATCMVEAGELDKAREILAAIPEDQQNDPAVEMVLKRIELAEQVATLGDPEQLKARLAVDPNDHQARFDLAKIYDAQGLRDAAADELLAIMKADREWEDDGARKQLVQFFELWGVMDKATLAARRKLSSLLFK